MLPKSISFNNEELVFLDQTKLPGETVYETQSSVEHVWDSIKRLKVRGAPAIGIAGAYGLYLSSKTLPRDSFVCFFEALKATAEYLDSSRPTAYNLKWALDRMLATAKQCQNHSIESIIEALRREAVAIHEEDRELCRAIGNNGLGLIQDGMGILTHCNAGSLAVSELGTALSPMYVAHEKGINFKVYASETRPLLQGARLTAWELQQAGIEVTVITDNMVAHMMDEGLIDMVIVGTDRVAANGDVANKIGTHGVAIISKHFNIPFYVACPASTIDLNTPSGNEIEIEERAPDEVSHFSGRSTTPAGVNIRNPAFDVTPHRLVSGLITEKGIYSNPYAEKMKEDYAR